MTTPWSREEMAFVDERIDAAQLRTTAVGTVTDIDSVTFQPSVTFDGSALAVPVIPDITEQPSIGDRVMLQKFGSQWILMGRTSSVVTPSNETLLFETTLGSSTANLAITDIPQTHRDLRITLDARDTTTTGTVVDWCFYLNNDTGAHYYTNKVDVGGYHASGGINNTGYGALVVTSNAGNGAITRGESIVEFPGYSRGSGNKIGIFRSFALASGTTYAYIDGGFGWSGPSGAGSTGITQINLIPNGGTSLASGSLIRVYLTGAYG